MKGKRWLSMVCFFALLCSSLCFGKVHTANSYEVAAEEDFLWEVIGNNDVRILGTDLSHAATEIVIPEKIDGKNVVEIGTNAFWQCENLKRVTVPKTVRYIGQGAFSFSYSMEGVIVAEENPNYRSENGILYSKDRTVLYYVPATAKGEFVIPWEVDLIGASAFESCRGLQSVFFSQSADGKSSASAMGTNINGLFSECTCMKEIRVEEGHKLYQAVDGALLSHDGKVLLTVPFAYESKEYIVPDGVEEIDLKCFSFCKNIESIRLPDSIRSLDKYSFYGCSQLREVIIPEGVRELKEGTFLGCSALERIVIPDSVVWTEKNFVQRCNRLAVIEAGGREDELWEALRAETDWRRETQSKKEPTKATDEMQSEPTRENGESKAEQVKYLWEVNPDGDVVITGTKGYEYVTELVIPEKIDGKNVVGIGENAFVDNLLLESVFVPHTVVSVHDRAFWETVALKEIRVATDNPAYAAVDGVLYDKEISHLVWVPDTYEGTFRIPETVRSVSGNAFWKCLKLEEVYVPAMMDIGVNIKNPLGSVDPFHTCTALRRIEVDEDHILYRSVDGIVYSKDGKVLYIVPIDYENSIVTVPEEAEEIAGFAFSYCRRLEKVELPEGLKGIGEHAFVWCEGLTEISIPEGVREIRDYTFWGCESVRRITLPASVKHVAKYAFSATVADKVVYEGNRAKELIAAIKNERAWDYVLAEPAAVVLAEQFFKEEEEETETFTYQLTSKNNVVITGLTDAAKADTKNRELVIPEVIHGSLVVGIGEGAFAGDPLTSVIFPEGLQEIGRGAFYGCNLKRVTIPKYVYYIAPRAFGANYGLERIDVAEGNETYTSYFGCLYTYEKSILLLVPANYEYDRFVVPESVEIIEEYAFGNNRNIKKLQMKKEGIEIREKAFWNMLSYEE